MFWKKKKRIEQKTNVISKLSKEEFQQFFNPPMKPINQGLKPINSDIQKSVLIAIEHEGLVISNDAISLSYIYEDSSTQYNHFLFSIGIKHRFMVIVTGLEKIIGYHLLQLDKLYSIKD